MHHEDKVHSHCLTAIFHIRCPQNNSYQRSTDGIIPNRCNSNNEINVETASIESDRKRALSLKIAYFWLLLKWHINSSSLRISFVRSFGCFSFPKFWVSERDQAVSSIQIFDILPKIKRLMIVFCFLFSTSFRRLNEASGKKTRSLNREKHTAHNEDECDVMRYDTMWTTVLNA